MNQKNTDKQITMRSIIEQELRPVMESLFKRVSEGGPGLVMDGTPVYNDKAQFVGGKVINLACYTALELYRTEESFKELGRMIRMVSDMKMETWGILNGITGLYRLKKAGLLETIVDPETLESLKKSLDWRTFVDIDNHYALIHKPTNYYGVAFGIARHRELLGWEPEGHSRHLLNRLIEHIDQYSGELCFMDETAGDGRFDRYSILVPSELTSQLLATGWEVPEKIRIMLKKSAHIFLQLANEAGQGYAYGRSIGAYGDTAALEVLSAAAELGGILTEDELEIAYGYSIKLLKHMIEFWYDNDMDSINMWEKGRRTDTYRNKNRILGENLSLCMQMVNSYEHWAAAGYGEHELCSDFAERLRALPAHTFVRFAVGEYERGLAIVRDGSQVWSLPLINGGQNYYDKDPYMPAPFQNQVLQGVSECNHGQLVPQLVMEDGEILMPVSYIRTIVPESRGDSMTITCRTDGLCRMGNGIFISGDSRMDYSLTDHSRTDASDEAGRPQKAEGISAVTRYTFEPGQIRREDIFTVSGGRNVKSVRLVLLTYSGQPVCEGNTVRFGEGVICSMSADGYDGCAARSAGVDGSYDTPQGRLNTEVVWTKAAAAGEEELKLGWTIRYTV